MTDIDGWRREIGDDAPYFWTLCSTCATGYPSVRPDPRVLAKYWASNRPVENSSAEAEAAIWSQRIAQGQAGAERSWEMIAPLVGDKKGRFIDIACGLGETVALFQRKGWDAEGTDVDANAKPFHDKLGIVSRIGRFEDDLREDKFDLVQIAHAIYFIDDPLGFLRRVRERLLPGGRLVVVNSDFLASNSDNMPGYPHTFYPCAASMRHAFGLAGLETEVVHRRGGSLYLVARPGAVQTVPVNARKVWALYRTKTLRFNLFGRPSLVARRVAKRLLAGK